MDAESLCFKYKLGIYMYVKFLVEKLHTEFWTKHNADGSCKAWHHFLSLPCSWPRWCGRGSHPAPHTSSCCSSLGLRQPAQGFRGQPAVPRCVTNQHKQANNQISYSTILTGSIFLWMRSRSDILSLKPAAKLFGLMATKHWPWEQQHILTQCNSTQHIANFRVQIYSKNVIFS